MDELEPGQDRTRERFESVISAASPFLDLIMGVGDRVSKLLEPNDYEYYPIRAAEPGEGGEGPATGGPAEPGSAPDTPADSASGSCSFSDPDSDRYSEPDSG